MIISGSTYRIHSATAGSVSSNSFFTKAILLYCPFCTQAPLLQSGRMQLQQVQDTMHCGIPIKQTLRLIM